MVGAILVSDQPRNTVPIKVLIRDGKGTGGKHQDTTHPKLFANVLANTLREHVIVEGSILLPATRVLQVPKPHPGMGILQAETPARAPTHRAETIKTW